MKEEKPQEQIIFENLYYKHKGGWWRTYKAPSLGNVIHWLYVYGTLNIAEQVTVGDGIINLHGKHFCDYSYVEDNPNMPIFFNLQDEKYDFVLENQKYFLVGLNKFNKFVETIDERYSYYEKII